MDKLLVRGGKKLSGEVIISGSKNASLPIIISSILFNNDLELGNVPKVKDVYTLINLLKLLGKNSVFEQDNSNLKIFNIKKNKYLAPYSIMKTMRAGVLVLGPLLAKYGKAKVSLPGGCAIGARPINLHLYALKKLGAILSIKDGYVEAKVKNGLIGNKIRFKKISVGATECAIMSATLAKGKTIITNAAIEPEIIDLIEFLNSCGAKISWGKNRKIIIRGVRTLKPVKYNVIPDRIEAGTYAVAALITDGKLLIKKVNIDHLDSTFNVLKDMGAKIKIFADSFLISRNKKLRPTKIKTKVYPGFATDMQAQIMTLACLTDGTSVIKEDIFENRFLHISELLRMGANIEIKKQKAIVKGVKNFNSAEVMATDLRASVSLVLAGLSTKGITTINRLYHLDRGYEQIEKKLKLCGADIQRING